MGNIFDLYTDRYDKWFDENKFAYLTEIKALEKLIPKGEKGLEIGVGSGRFAEPLGIQFGIDPSQKMVEIAVKRGIKAIVGEGENLPFKDEEFDYVLLMVTLCFLDDPEKVIKEARRVIKNDGLIIIGIINKNSLLGKFYKEEKDSPFYKIARFYSPEEVIELLKKMDLQIFITYQTLFEFPSEMESIEEAEEGYGKGNFVVIGGKKSELKGH